MTYEAAGPGKPTQCTPASLVRTSNEQGLGDEHAGAVPSTKPVFVETKVTDPGSNPEGTGPPTGGCGRADLVVGGPDVGVVLVGEAGRELVVLCVLVGGVAFG